MDEVAQQVLLEFVNRARLQPAVEAERHGVVLPPGVLPVPPVAPSAFLADLARAHSQAMAEHGLFGHQGRDGRGPLDRAVAAGFPVTGSWAFGEILSVRLLDGDDVPLADQHADLFRSPGHRQIMLSPDMREVGIGLAQGAWSFETGVGGPASFLTETFAASGRAVFVTGVVFRDGNADKAYDAGEGVGGIVVSFDGQETRTTEAGGYTLALTGPAQGMMTLGAATLPLTVAAVNRKIDHDLTSGRVFVRDDGSYGEGGLPGR
ncbi:CAP domain-containing protein [Pararhodospirillum photometricum]|nr:CAP domain-containing protein [Pararhodospirillum photometricum]